MKISAAILLSVFTISFAFSQECNDFVKTQTDKFTGKETKETSTVWLDGGYKERVYFSFEKTDDKYRMLVTVSYPDINCFDESSKMIILYDDQSKDTMYNRGKLNCKGELTFYPDLTNISTKKITDIRFFSKKGYFDFEASKDEGTRHRQNVIQKMVACLTRF
jgi:hypothetical protein